MAIPASLAHELAESLRTEFSRNLVAQARAKQVLLEVREGEKNFPVFSEDLDLRVTFLAYAHLAAGCSLIEANELDSGRTEVTAAAEILESVYKVNPHYSEVRVTHCLIGAMGFFVVGQFSRAFILLSDVETRTETSRIIAAYIRKDWQLLIEELNSVQLAPTPERAQMERFDDWALNLLVARAIGLALAHIHSGDSTLLGQADSVLEDAEVICKTGSNPGQWWIARLLRLMLRNYGEGSLWNVLPPLFSASSQKKLADYIRSLAASPSPTTELWQSQIGALNLALDMKNQGGVINLRTSAGKTRVAEAAILQTLESNSNSKVLYLAPYKSLAFELERHFAGVMGPLGFTVSHLYGNARFSPVDHELFDDGQITIATPEKAKAMFRAAPELFENIKLIVIDEGHLFGIADREVRNEMFYEFVRVFAKKNGSRILLLSAVLPNADELAEWLGGGLVKSEWKPSAERLGKLYWNGDKVRLEWPGSTDCFNPNFIESKQIPKGKRGATRSFPGTKGEAVACTAVRLAELGPVLIFAGQAQWVPSMVRNVLIALGDEPELYSWPDEEWYLFESSCLEGLGENALELEAARFGVISHSNKLPSEVRLATENLIARKPPKIVVATTTLGQGVNLGISSVIVSSTFIGEKLQITHRDFWNICGRAGRAFVDSEGKVLIAIDKTRAGWQVRRDEAIANGFLSVNKLEPAESGLLQTVQKLKDVAGLVNISFDRLLEIVANDEFDGLGSLKAEAQSRLDCLDDQLLALHINFSGDTDDVTWVDDTFRNSLAAIQAKRVSPGFEEDVIRFLESRTRGILKKLPLPSVRRAIVASSLPLTTAIAVINDLDYFRSITDQYIAGPQDHACIEVLVREFESWAREKSPSLVPSMPIEDVLDEIRSKWLDGVVMSEIVENGGPDAPFVCSRLYGMELPWLIQSVAQKLDMGAESQRVQALMDLALCVELGLPNVTSARVFLAGVRSRPAAAEIGDLYGETKSSVSKLRNTLIDPEYRKYVLGFASESANAWLDSISKKNLKPAQLPRCSNFRLDTPTEVRVLQARRRKTIEGVYLSSLDGLFKVKVTSTNNLPFEHLANIPGLVFVRDGEVWKMTPNA